jgi:hypothetical protein
MIQPNLTMIETVLDRAKSWGFVCKEGIEGSWQILPQQPTERWKMHLSGDRWLLIIGDVPQIKLHPHEAIAFLERRCI